MSHVTPSPAPDLLLRDYQPQPKLSVLETVVEAPRFPVIDAHNHLGQLDIDWNARPLAALLDWLDAAHVRVFVDLDGGWGEDILHRHLDRFKAAAPERFIHYGGVDWSQWMEHGDRFGEWAAEQLRAQVARGAQGLKMWKNLGLEIRDQRGDLVPVDDARLDPVWAVAGELGIPVTIHIADPVAFFDPLDARNERWEELYAHPDWQFPAPPFPPFLDVVNALARVVERHPETVFVGAHVGCYAENLAWVGSLLDRAPNFYVDISARIAELGRQPYTARRFFLRYADRIVFGTDLPPDPAMYRIHYRFLETLDEYFDYSLDPTPPQGRWMIYGLGLPDDVLRKVYYDNAARLLGLD
ncbi:MAG: amidohydrolase family protein [Anaerolineae bacterium]|nr:amidohydrolase family protein [Anaerolineae bacterium]